MRNIRFAPLSRIAVRLLPFIVASFCGFAVSAYALQCGDNITTDTTLTADLGPCPNNGLGIDGIPAHVTLDLNGHTISGSGVGSGVVVGGVSPYGITIKGPGKIANFNAGLTMGGGASNALVYDLLLKTNQTGISINGPNNASIRILNNVIDGASAGQVGITLSDAGGVYFYQNEISGQSVAAVVLQGETSSSVDQNIITLNQAGILLSAPFLSCSSIHGNQITLNLGNGIQSGRTGGMSSRTQASAITDCAIQDNTVSWNGGSGIVVFGGMYSPLVQDNMVSHNRNDGINVIGSDDQGPIQVVGNRVLHNGTDLSWNGAGVNSCWKQNIFGTSSPQMLPQCP